MLGQETSLGWTVLTPSADLFPGGRTGRVRLGTDQLLKGADGESRISLGDFSMAMIDKIDHPQPLSRRFTVGY